MLAATRRAVMQRRRGGRLRERTVRARRPAAFVQHVRLSRSAPPLRRARARAAEERGIAIAEMIVTMAVMIVVGAALTNVVVEASTAEVRINRSFQAQVQGRLGLDKLRRELHCAGSVSVVSANGAAVAAGTSGNGINVILGGYCPTNGLTSDTSLSVKVTWCTSASTLKTGDYALYRLASLTSQPVCSTGGIKWADYLTTATPFCLPDTSHSCGGTFKSTNSLPTLQVNLPLNLNGPSSTSSSFRLVDDIALRNSART